MARLNREHAEMVQSMYSTISNRSKRNHLRLNMSSAEERLKNLGVSIPESMEDLQIPLNWPQKAIEVFATRQLPQFYSIRNTASELFADLEDIQADNSFTWLEPQIIESADLFGVAFVFTTYGDTSRGEPEVLSTPRTALSATCVIDPRSRRTLRALEVVDHDKGVMIGYFPGFNVTVRRVNGGLDWDVLDVVDTGHERVLCAPYVHDASLSRPMGRSRLTPTIMEGTFAGTRTLLRQEVSATFYQAPRLALMGADDALFTDPTTGKKMDPWDVITGSIWGVPDIAVEDDPDTPDSLRRASMEKLSQMSMQPYSDQYRLIASVVSGASAVPLHYLGVVQDSNPTSAAAIEATEVDLVNSVKAQNRSLSMGRKHLALDQLTALHGDLSEDALRDLRSLTPRWGDPRTRSIQEQSQFVAMQVSAGNFAPGTEATLRQLPIDPEDVRIMAQEAQIAQGASVFEQFMAASEAPDAAEAAPAVEPLPDPAQGV